MAHMILPASPTLTNPDMILPYGDELEDTKASMLFAGADAEGLGLLTPTTPIIYGNGTMLSDIGEVTEVESTSGRRARQTTTKLARNRDMPIGSSPTIGYDAVLKRSKIGTHQRQVSIESSSTVPTEPHIAEEVEEFDDLVSVNDSEFLGDDEESTADDAYESEVATAQPALVTRQHSVRVIEEEDSSSSAALSRRAERILANAKKRLDLMEGNLSRARSSLYITPSSSMSSTSSPGPTMNSRDIQSQTIAAPTSYIQRIVPQMGMPPSKHRQMKTSNYLPNGSGHGRVMSDNAVPTSLTSLPEYSRPTNSRSHAEEVRGYKQGSPTQPHKLATIESSPNGGATSLKTQIENDTVATEDDDTDTRPRQSKHNQMLDSDRSLTRSASSMQMRDLTDKMKDLKGKISTLRDKAKEDNMRRRSLQSLRTPSPFTAADQWHAANGEYKSSTLASEVASNKTPNRTEKELSISSSNEPPNHNKDHRRQASGSTSIYESVEEEVHTIQEDEQEGETSDEVADERSSTPTQHSDAQSKYEGDDYDSEPEEHHSHQDDYDDNDARALGAEAPDDDRSESESLYHDAQPVPLSHEDREDAFDYERFFLHSALGTISQQSMRRRSSNGSVGSDDSVMTAKAVSIAPTTTVSGVDNARAIRGHVKSQKSVDSVSTFATFATAEEDFDGSHGALLSHKSSELTQQDETLTSGDQSNASQPVVSATGNGDCAHSEQLSMTLNADLGWAHSVPRSEDGRSVQGNGYINSPIMVGARTQRAFPLVNRPKLLTSASFDGVPGHRAITSASDPAALDGTIREAMTFDGRAGSIGSLNRDDQILVDRLVASLGRSILDLQGVQRASSDARMMRRKLEIAYRVLEGDHTA